jgi:hypothetical protein
MIPTLSEVEAYTTDHSADAADHWDGLADRREDAHWQVRNPPTRLAAARTSFGSTCTTAAIDPRLRSR